MTDFTKLRAANIARQAEWPGAGNIDLAFRGLELAGEVGELANLVKKLVRIERSIRGTSMSVPDLRMEIAKEAADVVICLDMLCMDLGINLGWYVETKFNETSEKHGLQTRLGKED